MSDEPVTAAEYVELLAAEWDTKTVEDQREICALGPFMAAWLLAKGQEPYIEAVTEFVTARCSALPADPNPPEPPAQVHNHSLPVGPGICVACDTEAGLLAP